MRFVKRFGRMLAAAGRLLDFGGSYNRDMPRQRLSRPGWLRDRDAFERDRLSLQSDVDCAAIRLGGQRRG